MVYMHLKPVNSECESSFWKKNKKKKKKKKKNVDIYFEGLLLALAFCCQYSQSLNFQLFVYAKVVFWRKLNEDMFHSD